jgi:hypothetical protein
MRSLLGLCALLALAAVVACGPGTRLEAVPPTLKADGVSTTKLTFYADDPDGTPVYFETDRGTFREDGVDVESTTVSLAGGKVSVDLRASIYPGTATVTATSDRGSDAAVAVEFLKMVPSGRGLSFECDTVNIGALFEPTPDISVHCRLDARDREGDAIDPRSLAANSFGFLTEAGTVRPEVQDDGYGHLYFLYTPAGGGSEPADVEPVASEPSRSGETGGTRNPRDGLVTIVAWLSGEEGFQDGNSNGLYDPGAGETFFDQGEPFCDVDDDGAFDPGAGDTYLDINGNNRYDGPNGTWDAVTIVSATFKILWTGPPQIAADAARVEISGGRDFPAGATREVTAYFVDRNINPIAALDTDTVTFYPGCYSCTYSSTYTFGMGNARGFDIDEDGAVLGNLFETPVFRINITNTNAYPESEDFTLAVEAAATPARYTSDGSSLYPTTHRLTTEARLLGGGRE